MSLMSGAFVAWLDGSCECWLTTTFVGRDTRIFSTGCAEENTKLNDCFYEKKDWRACTEQVRYW